MSNSPANLLNPVDRLSSNVSLQAANRSALEQSTASRSSTTTSTSTSTSYNYTGREREANNTFTQALQNNHIGDYTHNASTSYSGTVSSSDSLDLYAFTVRNSKNTVNLSLSGMNANANLFLYDSRGQEIGASAKPGTQAESIQLSGLEAGTYYAGVYRAASNTVNTINYNLGVSARESRKQLVLDVTNLTDLVGLDSGSPPEWYAKVNMGGTRFQTRPPDWGWFTGVYLPFSYNPNWSFTRDIPLTGGSPVNISLEVWDEDLFFDDQADINSGSGRSLEFRVDLQSGRVTSNDLRISSFNLGETKSTEGNDSNRNRITFKISTRYV
ncbi:pre-peptidase C-terminal domain-containing protein [Egbenema bharatensis]|uniref:pre-peptidase C-terminal domain-containing protein n=1 Tax=Egbenema bharatensis TaxID=3463334 RepID=UPI003A8A3E61